MRALGCVVAMLAAAGASACGGDDGEGRSEPGRVRLAVDLVGHDLHPEGPPTVILGQSFTLRGAAPNEPDARDVDLLASPYPHRGWRRIATERGPSVAFRLRPRINTRYRLRLSRHPRVHSRALKIYVDLRGRLVASLPAPGVTQVQYTGRARSPVSPGEGRVHFYLREDGRGPLRKVATGRPRQGDATSATVTARYRDPDPRNGDRFVSCAVGLLAKGFGHPSPSDPDCGNRTMAATERRLNAPG
jgi:hypothetical protein